MSELEESMNDVMPLRMVGGDTDTGVSGKASAPVIRRSNAGRLGIDALFATRHPLGAVRQVLSGRSGDGSVPVGPAGPPFVGAWREYANDPYGFLDRAAAEYGDVFRVPLPVWDMVVFTHPDFVGAILGDRDGNFAALGPLWPWFERWGAALPAMEGPRFKQRRRALAPMFSKHNLTRYSDIILDEMIKRIDAWDRVADTGEQIDLQHEFAQVTLPAFLRSMFSTSITDEQIVELDHDIRMLMSWVAGVVFRADMPNMIPLPRRDSVPASYLRARRTMSRLIDERVANPIEGTDLLARLLEATEADGSPVPRKDQIHDLITLCGGGFDTVVNALAWTFGLLSVNREANDKLYAEVDSLGGAAPTMADLAHLTWTKACFDEGQRIQGGPVITRFAARDVEVGGFRLRKGTQVGIAWRVLQNDPRWWNEPDRYDPTRFIDKDAIAARPGSAFIPFGAGPHHCIGSAMAYMNAQFIMTLITQRYRISTPEGWRPEPQFALATGLKGGLPVTLTRRTDVNAAGKVAQ
jgi:cytochrome P450